MRERSDQWWSEALQARRDENIESAEREVDAAIAAGDLRFENDPDDFLLRLAERRLAEQEVELLAPPDSSTSR